MNMFLIVEAILLVLALRLTSRNRSLMFFFCCVILLIMTGFHDGRGDCDFPQYMNFFEGKTSMYGSMDTKWGYELELPYLYFCKVLRMFGKSDFVYIFGYALFVGIPFMIMVKKYSCNAPMTLLLLFTILATYPYLTYLTIHRQMVATVFAFLALLIYESNTRYKYLLSIVLLFIALIGHSTSYFLIPVLLFAYFFKLRLSRKTLVAICVVSMIIGLISSFYFSHLMDALMGSLGGIDVVGRTTSYLINDVYEETEKSIFNLLPLTFTTCSFIYFSDEKELRTVFLQGLFYATVVFNLFSMVPLINRSITIFVFLGIVGALPKAMDKNRWCRLCMLAVMLINWYIAYRQYVRPGFRIPYHFLFS